MALHDPFRFLEPMHGTFFVLFVFFCGHSCSLLRPKSGTCITPNFEPKTGYIGQPRSGLQDCKNAVSAQRADMRSCILAGLT